MTDLGQLPLKAAVRKRIVSEVLEDNGISMAELVGRSRIPRIVDARREAAVMLLAEGFSIGRIAKILRRDHATVLYYFSDKKREKMRNRQRGQIVLDVLNADVRAIVAAYAKATDATPLTTVIEWISERARFEAESRARAAA